MKEGRLDDWMGFTPVALLATSPEDLAEQAGLKFREAHDDLDFVTESAFSGSRGTVFGLVSHIGAPVPGTEVLAHREDIARGVPELVDEALDALHLSRDHVRWILDPSVVPGTRKVFISSTYEDRNEASELLVSLLRRELAEHGFEAILAERPPVGRAFHRHIRDLISQCRYVVLAEASETPWTYYELGVATALGKPVWRYWRGALVRWGETEALSLERTRRIPESNRIGEAVEEFVASLAGVEYGA